MGQGLATIAIELMASSLTQFETLNCPGDTGQFFQQAQGGRHGTSLLDDGRPTSLTQFSSACQDQIENSPGPSALPSGAPLTLAGFPARFPCGDGVRRKPPRLMSAAADDPYRGDSPLVGSIYNRIRPRQENRVPGGAFFYALLRSVSS